MPPLPRATCWASRIEVPIRRDGTLREHRMPRTAITCTWSGVSPYKVPRRLTVTEWATESAALFGPDPYATAYLCPGCGLRTTIAEWDAIGKPGLAGQECIGRHVEGRGCQLKANTPRLRGPWIITRDDGREVPCFPFARPTAPRVVRPAAVLAPGCGAHGCAHHYGQMPPGCICPAWFDSGGHHILSVNPACTAHTPQEIAS